jgi:hypothetical protein
LKDGKAKPIRAKSGRFRAQSLSASSTFARPFRYHRQKPEVTRQMARDIRTMPKGLIAPLSQAALASLRALGEGGAGSMPEEHRIRLRHLALIETSAEGDAITALGRERLVSDR